MSEKIKEEATLKAVKNYSVPPLPKEYYENMLKLQNNAYLSDVNDKYNSSALQSNGWEKTMPLIDSINFKKGSISTWAFFLT